MPISLIDEDDEILSPSVVIRQAQYWVIRQYEMVVAALALFGEARARVPTSRDSSSWDDETFRMNVAAKAFVYEAATLRQLVVDVARRFPQFSEDAAAGLREFDRALPQLTDLRNSQAHLDERLNFRARRKVISTSSLEYDPHRFGAMTPPQVCGTTIQGTLEDGRHARIDITAESADAARSLIVATFSLVARQTRQAEGR